MARVALENLKKCEARCFSCKYAKSPARVEAKAEDPAHAIMRCADANFPGDSCTTMDKDEGFYYRYYPELDTFFYSSQLLERDSRNSKACLSYTPSNDDTKTR